MQYFSRIFMFYMQNNKHSIFFNNVLEKFMIDICTIYIYIYTYIYIAFRIRIEHAKIFINTFFSFFCIENEIKSDRERSIKTGSFRTFNKKQQLAVLLLYYQQHLKVLFLNILLFIKKILHTHVPFTKWICVLLAFFF